MAENHTINLVIGYLNKNYTKEYCEQKGVSNERVKNLVKRYPGWMFYFALALMPYPKVPISPLVRLERIIQLEINKLSKNKEGKRNGRKTSWTVS